MYYTLYTIEVKTYRFYLENFSHQMLIGPENYIWLYSNLWLCILIWCTMSLFYVTVQYCFEKRLNFFDISATKKNFTCLPPFNRSTCAFQCVSKCEDVTLKVKCSENVTRACSAGCVCPSGKYLQDGTCKKLTECKCVWNVDILGRKPLDYKEYYDPGERIIHSECQDL